MELPMPLNRSATAPIFDIPGLTVAGLASPSRGTCETSVWRLTIAPDTPGVPHSLDKEEIFVALSGRAVATVGHDSFEIYAGDTLVVPADQVFSLANPGPDAFEALAAAPVGVRARLSNGDFFAPPWTL